MAAKEHPRYQYTEWPDYEFHEFPMMVYPGAADPLKPYDEKGKVLPGVIVQNSEEADKVLGIDRNDPEPTVEVAPAPKPAPKSGAAKTVATSSPGVSRVENEEDEHVTLDTEAAQLGIPKYDKSWSIARKVDTIETFKAAPVV